MDMTAPLHAYVEKRLVHPMHKVIDEDAARMDVELVDMAQVKGRVRMECKVHVRMPTAGGHADAVEIHEADDDMYKAIDRAHDRLLLQVKRNRDKQRDASHRRKNAAAERAAVAREQLTSAQEPWERETQAFEQSSAGAGA